MDMWDATQTSIINDKVVVKTIYDPSPAGMTVPRYNAFTGFTTTGASVSSGTPTNCNVVGSFSQGWSFKRNTSDGVGVFWATVGNRSGGTAPTFVASFGQYWLACMNSGQFGGCYFSFSSSSVTPQQNVMRYLAFPVRPALSELP